MKIAERLEDEVRDLMEDPETQKEPLNLRLIIGDKFIDAIPPGVITELQRKRLFVVMYSTAGGGYLPGDDMPARNDSRWSDSA